MRDLGIIEGNLVDVLSDRVYPARITVSGGKVVSVEETDGRYREYILPGLIDSHVHIESSTLVPSRFAEIAVPRGTTAVVADPHEIANVMGMKGIAFMIEDSMGVPMKFRFTVPSSVPTSANETTGATIGTKNVERLMEMADMVALGEVMDVRGVIDGDKDIMRKIEIARKHGKPVDGHAPGLTGEDLDKYIAAGISTDHECTTEAEAEEKAGKGMIIQIREGSAGSNMKELIPVAERHRFFLCTDDIHAGDCMSRGHMDRLLRMAVGYGIDPIRAVKAATLWPAQHYGLDGGSIRAGGPADLTIVSDLRNFNVDRVYIDGRMASQNGRALFIVRPKSFPTAISRRSRTRSEDCRVRCDDPEVTVRVIQVADGQVGSRQTRATLRTEGGRVMPDPEGDVLLMAVASRYDGRAPATAFVRGFGLGEGAIASSVSHDAHNLVAVATSYELLAEAIDAVSSKGGYYFTDGEREASSPLPVAGLMSTEDPEAVVFRQRHVLYMARSGGCKLRDPFMTLSFQTLLSVPSLKLCDRGLYDSIEGRFVDPIVR